MLVTTHLVPIHTTFSSFSRSVRDTTLYTSIFLNLSSYSIFAGTTRRSSNDGVRRPLSIKPIVKSLSGGAESVIGTPIINFDEVESTNESLNFYRVDGGSSPLSHFLFSPPLDCHTILCSGRCCQLSPGESELHQHPLFPRSIPFFSSMTSDTLLSQLPSAHFWLSRVDGIV